MSEVTLLIGAGLNSLAAGAFLYMGFRLGRSPVEPHARLAGRAFVLWWYCIGAFMFIWGAIPMVLAALGVMDLVVYLALVYPSLVLLCVAVGSLLYYILYLFTGRRRLAVPVAAYYLGVLLLLVYVITIRGPSGVAVQDWWVDLDYRTPLGPLYHLAMGLLILPTTLGALGYFSLITKTTDRRMRLRISVVSWGFVVWGLATLLARVMEWDAGQILARSGVGLIVAFSILAAYRSAGTADKRSVGQIMGGRSVLPSGAAASMDTKAQVRRRREKELQWRMRNLV